MTGDPLVEIEGFEVRYPDFTLGPIDLGIERGSLTGIAGPNGAGKSTLIGGILGLVRAHGGRITVAGLPSAQRATAMLAEVGYASENGAELIPELTGDEYLDLHFHIHRRAGRDPERLAATRRRLLEILEFDPPDRPIGSYSMGMRRKTQLVAALMHEPTVALLDEPRSGLDPVAAFALEHDLLPHLLGMGGTVVVCTHDLFFVERRCDRVVLLYGGTVLRDGAPGAMRGEQPSLEAAFVALVRAQRPAGEA